MLGACTEAMDDRSPESVAGSGGSADPSGFGGASEPGMSGGTGGTLSPTGGTAGDGDSEAVLSIVLDTSATGADVSEAVQNYPLAVALTANNFDFEKATPDGADLRFFQGTQELNYEVEFWDRPSAAALIWVKVPQIMGNMSEQVIELRYGSGAPSTSQDAHAVFSTEDGFYGVWHLGEDGNTTPDGYKDSSAHEGHATGVNMIPGSSVPARLGHGSHLDNPDGQNTARFVRVQGEKAAAYNPDAPITVSVWALAYSYPITSYETIMSKGDTSWSLQRVTYAPNTGYQSCLLAGSGDTYHFCIYNFAAQPLVTEEWLHFQLVLNEPTMTLFINGEQNATGNGNSWNMGDHPLGIGNQTQFDGRRQWDGILDEARVMRVARTGAWAKLDYQSQKPDQTLIEYRKE